MRKTIDRIFLGLITLGVLAFTLDWAVRSTIHFQNSVIVPDLSGKAVLEALDILSKNNLGLRQEGAEFNDSVPLGTVLRQQPPAGMSVREGKIIRVTLSQGGESIFTPDLIAQTLRSAEIALRLNTLSLGEVRTRPSLKYEKDVVISQEPKPKTILQKNALVHVVVSDGPPQDGLLLMPDFTGKKMDDVSNWAKDVKVKVETSEEESPGEPGTILRQSVQPDDAIQPDSSVKFVISKEVQGASAQTGAAPSQKFHFEIPQGESGKQYQIVLVDGSSSKELWKGSPEPGSKLDVPLPSKLSPTARIRIFVNGILTEERVAQ